MKKSYIVTALIAIATVISIFTNTSYAWFTDYEMNKKTFEVGKINYDCLDTLIKTSNYTVPGASLFANGGELRIQNKSNITTHIRMKIFVSYHDKNDVAQFENVVFTNQKRVLQTDPILPGDLFSIDIDSKWVLNQTAVTEEDGRNCYEYFGATSSIYTVPAYLPTDPSILVFTNVSLNGALVDTSYSGAKITFKFVFQAKQAEFATWVDIGSTEIDAFAIQ